jgi:hypothetical protein
MQIAGVFDVHFDHLELWDAFRLLSSGAVKIVQNDEALMTNVEGMTKLE